MSVSDPIADFLTRIRNACRAQHRYVDVDWSKLRQHIADILKSLGFIEDYLLKQEGDSRGTMRLFLKYSAGRAPVIRGLVRMSKPGCRRYVKHDQIPIFYGGFGVPIVSTSQGVLSGSEAKKRKVGGELLCLIW